MTDLSQRIQKVKPSPTMALTGKAKAMKADGINVVSFAAGEPDFDTPEAIKQAAIAAIQEGFTKYTAVGGIDPLKEALIQKMDRDSGLQYKKSEILVSNGGKHSLYNIAQVLLDEGDEVIIPSPYWVSYPDQVLLNQGVPVFIETKEENGFKVTADQLRAAITDKTKYFIINSPSNPTGSAYTKEDLLALAEVLIEKNIMCVSDEIYEKVVYDNFEQVSIASVHPKMKDLCIIVNGASKVYSMTGWRMGYSAGPEDITAAMAKLQGQVTSNVCSIVQKACIEAFAGSQAAVNLMVTEFEKRRNYIVDRINSIDGLSCFKPEGAFYVFPNMKELYGHTSEKGRKIESSSDFAAYLLDDYQIAAVPGEGFGAEGFLRFSYATSMDQIEEGMNRLENAVLALK